MITIFNREELTLVNDVARLSKIRHALASNHIDYKIRFSTPAPGGGRYNSGTFGRNIAVGRQHLCGKIRTVPAG